MAVGTARKLGFLGRSLYIQGSWNFRQMQGLGFFFALAPWLRRVRPSDHHAAARRHMGFFNTHPYMASYILGVVARREEDGDADGARQAKEALMGPLGASGDSLFWGEVRPLAIVLALCVAAFSPWGAVLFLLLAYNAVHLWARWSLFERGYGAGDDLLAPLKGFLDRFPSDRGRTVTVTGLGFLVGWVALRSKVPGSFLALFALSLLLHRRGLPNSRIALPVLAFALVLGFLGGGVSLPW